ncbi:hypothetical protein ACKKBF_B14000 [Auxenochlorella protothecoides x Auxenochlorella symbiontica]
MSGARPSAPTAILQQALRDFEGDAVPQTDPFIPSASWSGPKHGYYFSKGAQGTGYYRDDQSHPGGGNTGSDGAGPGPSSMPPPPPRVRARDAEELLREAEEAAGPSDIGIVDAKGLRRLVLALERKATQNLEQRTRFADQPEKFLESEVELDEAVNALRVVASTPELYPELIASGALETLLPLLHHDNADIAAAVMELLAELTSEDAVDEAREEGRALAAALASAGLLAALAHRLPAFDEGVPEEAQAVHSALGVLEGLVEVDPGLAAPTLRAPGLLPWLLRRVRARAGDDAVRAAAAELLGILVQAGGEPREALVAGGGVDALLQAAAPYRARAAEEGEEQEYLENLVTALCALLALSAGQRAFVEGEGIELMLLILRGNSAARVATLRCIDFATTNSQPACERLVDAGGLKSLFGIFMGKIKAKKADEVDRQEEEERSVSIITNLFQMLPTSSRRDRVASKFVENEFEKVDRLVEVYLRYEQRVAAGEERLASAQVLEAMDEDELLLARMEAGLFTLQQAALVLGSLWLLQEEALRKRVLMLLHQKSHSLAAVRRVLLGRRSALGGDGAPEDTKKQYAHISAMLRALGHVDAPDGAVAGGAEAATPGQNGVDAPADDGASRDDGGSTSEAGRDRDPSSALQCGAGAMPERDPHRGSARTDGPAAGEADDPAEPGARTIKEEGRSRDAASPSRHGRHSRDERGRSPHEKSIARRVDSSVQGRRHRSRSRDDDSPARKHRHRSRSRGESPERKRRHRSRSRNDDSPARKRRHRSRSREARRESRPRSRSRDRYARREVIPGRR